MKLYSSILGAFNNSSQLNQQNGPTKWALSRGRSLSTAPEFKNPLEQMMQHYNPGFIHLKHLGYGCHCSMWRATLKEARVPVVNETGFKEDPDFKSVQYGRTWSGLGIGPAVDALDATCKKYNECLKCVQGEFGETCLNEFKEYDFGIHAGQAVCNNEKNTCERAICECDRQFAIEHSNKEHLYDMSYSHIYRYLLYYREIERPETITVEDFYGSIFDDQDSCPNWCSKDEFSLTNTELYGVDMDGDFKICPGGLISGRKCYMNQHLDKIVSTEYTHRWIMVPNEKKSNQRRLYNRSNVACPMNAAWYVPQGGWYSTPGSDRLIPGGPATNLRFNGLTQGQMLSAAKLRKSNRVDVDEQCCTPQDAPFSIFNANSHQCCPNGSLLTIGDIC